MFWRVLSAGACLLVSAAAFAQGWIEYTSRQDFFSINFPGEPIIEEIMYETEYGATMPGRRYSANQGEARYSMTVVDFSRTTTREVAIGLEKRGAVQFASTAIRNKGKVTFDAYAEVQVVPGQQVQVTLPDQRRLYAEIHFHDNRLYIMEAEVPPGTVPAILYQASLGFIDAEGNQIRYREDRHAFPDGRPRQR